MAQEAMLTGASLVSAAALFGVQSKEFWGAFSLCRTGSRARDPVLRAAAGSTRRTASRVCTTSSPRRASRSRARSRPRWSSSRSWPARRAGERRGAVRRVARRSAPDRGAEPLDPNFFRTVVLLLEHQDEGAVGVVLNRPSEQPAPRCHPRPGRGARRAGDAVPGRPRAARGGDRARRVPRPAARGPDRGPDRPARRRPRPERARHASSTGPGSSWATPAGARASSRRRSPRRPGSSSPRSRPTCSPPTRPCSGGRCSTARAAATGSWPACRTTLNLN